LSKPKEKNKNMMQLQTPEEFKLDISKPTKDFKEHLTPDNNRILFSGPFGSGKTYFLNEYFKDQKQNVIHLYPVNYSISSNQDIFELIKHDILFELMHKDLEYVKHSFSKLLTTQMFLQSNAYNIVKQIASNFTAVGKSIAGIADELLKLVKENDSFHRKRKIDQQAEIIQYLESFTKRTGFEQEEDVYTQTIRELIDQLEEKYPEQETVLIIDDLDRIDPEHIFRILNIFSAHFDLKTGMPNKFGFDKIILVCDINNIRNIFHAKYGSDVDFSGYIDKFYSKEVFHFDNKAVLKSNLFDILKSIKLNNTGVYLLPLNNPDYYGFKMSFFILKKMVDVSAVNLRSISSIIGKPISLDVYEIPFKDTGDGLRYSNGDFMLIIALDFLKKITGDSKSLKTAIRKCTEIEVAIQSNHLTSEGRELLSPLVAVLAYHEGKVFFLDGREDNIKHSSGAIFNYQSRSVHNEYGKGAVHTSVFEVTNSIDPNKAIQVYYFDLLLETLEVLQKHGMYQ
jgi:hypothetical protein